MGDCQTALTGNYRRARRTQLGWVAGVCITANARAASAAESAGTAATPELAVALWSTRSGSDSAGAASSAQQHPESQTSHQDGRVRKEGHADESIDESRPCC